MHNAIRVGSGAEHWLWLMTMGTNNDSRPGLACLHCQQLLLLTNQVVEKSI